MNLASLLSGGWRHNTLASLAGAPLIADYPHALGVLLTTQLAAALFFHALSRRGGPAPGLPRLLAALPVLTANLYAPRLFTRDRDAVTIVLVAFNTAWLSSFKTLLWVLGRSALAAPGVGAAPFAALLLAPLTPVSEVGPSQRRRGRLSEAASGRRMLIDGSAKFVLLAVIAALLHTHSADFPPVFRSFLYGLALYALLSSIMDGPGAAISRFLGVKVSPHFDEPWLSTSIASFWNSRWDLAAGNALRQLIYDPLTEGHLVGRPAAPPGKAEAAAPAGPEPIPRPSIQFLGSFLCFLASGTVHEGIFWYLKGHTSGGSWLSFFLIQVPVTAAERIVLQALRGRGLQIPRLLLNLWTVWFECYAASRFFFGPAEDAGLVDAVIGNVYNSMSGWIKL